MSKQLHKNFIDSQVKSLLKNYVDKKIKLNYILQFLEIKIGQTPIFIRKESKKHDNKKI